jgi:Bacterial capsule synthesis protein PGA_cap
VRPDHAVASAGAPACGRRGAHGRGPARAWGAPNRLAARGHPPHDRRQRRASHPHARGRTGARQRRGGALRLRADVPAGPPLDRGRRPRPLPRRDAARARAAGRLPQLSHAPRPRAGNPIDGWDVCSTASNHSLDAGQGGVDATIRALRRAGIPFDGTAASPRGRRRFPILEAEGARVAFLSYTAVSNGQLVPNPWSLNWASPRRILADARAARRRGADAVIVNLHWGPSTSTRQRRNSSRSPADSPARRT